MSELYPYKVGQKMIEDHFQKNNFQKSCKMKYIFQTFFRFFRFFFKNVLEALYIRFLNSLTSKLIFRIDF